MEIKYPLDKAVSDLEKVDSTLKSEHYKSFCDYCGDVIDTEDEDGDDSHDISAGDESITMCSTCYDHFH